MPNKKERLKIIATQKDDVTFISLVSTALKNAIEKNRSRDLYVVQVDNWFGGNWLGFRGKLSGALGVARNIGKGQLVIPPFVPKRILIQTHYLLLGRTKNYAVDDSVEQLHIQQSSEQNFQRYLSKYSDSATFIWYSGNSLKNGAGSMMIYSHEKDSMDEGCYVSFKRAKTWNVIEHLGIPLSELKVLLGNT